MKNHENENDKFHLTRKQWFLLILFSLVNLLCGSIYSIQAPLYPQIAVSKNATALEYSIIFGSYEGTVFISSLFSGTLIHTIGPKISLFIGVLFQGISSTCFGFVYLISDLKIFLGTSLFIRIVEGLSFSMSFSALYSFTPTEFPQNTELIMGILEMAVTLGFALGPAIGGTLAQVGGFYLPFVSVGVGTGLLSFILIFFLWNLEKPTKGTNSGAFRLFIKPSVLINYLVIISNSIVLSFNYSILEQFLYITFNFEAYESGLLFGLCAILGIFSPVWAILVKKLKNPLQLTLIGLLVNIIGNIFIGPIPITGITPQIWLTVFGLAVASIATNLTLLTSFLNASACAKNEGYGDDGGTMSLVTACFLCCFSFGNMVGAPIGGALYDAFGFRNASYFTISLLSIMALMVFVKNSLIQKAAKKSIV